MRHQKEGRKLKRTASHRKALLRNMVTSLFEHEKIETTDAKAKELRKVADKMITLGKRGDLHARWLASSVISNKKIVKKLFDDIAPRFKERKGGYSRIIKVGRRRGDNAPLSIIELLPQQEDVPRTRGTKETKAKAVPKKTGAQASSWKILFPHRSRTGACLIPQHNSRGLSLPNTPLFRFILFCWQKQLKIVVFC